MSTDDRSSGSSSGTIIMVVILLVLICVPCSGVLVFAIAGAMIFQTAPAPMPPMAVPVETMPMETQPEEPQEMLDEPAGPGEISPSGELPPDAEMAPEFPSLPGAETSVDLPSIEGEAETNYSDVNTREIVKPIAPDATLELKTEE